jgi:hypothetical protein
MKGGKRENTDRRVAYKVRSSYVSSVCSGSLLHGKRTKDHFRSASVGTERDEWKTNRSRRTMAACCTHPHFLRLHRGSSEGAGHLHRYLCALELSPAPSSPTPPQIRKASRSPSSAQPGRVLSRRHTSLRRYVAKVKVLPSSTCLTRGGGKTRKTSPLALGTDA